MNLEKIWRSVIEAMRLVVTSGTYNTYLRQTELVEIKEQSGRWIGVIGCNSAYTKDYLDRRYGATITGELEKVIGGKAEVVFKIHDPASKKNQETNKLGPLFEETSGGSQKSEEKIKKANLRTDYTFENYAVGGSNQMAFAAAQAVSKKLGKAYNPLFIYGGVGVGKTHLMQAIGQVAIEQGTGPVLFCPGEEFTNDLVTAIQQKTTDKVRQKYRKLKLLMIDDVQFIAGKTTVQEEFFHTFNAILAEGGQVVMTSDRPPAEIARLEDRLRSRFGAGLIVDVGTPDFELRTAILLIKTKQSGLPVSMRAAQLVAEQIEGIRELEGFLTKIRSELELKQTEVSDEMIEKLLNVQQKQNGHKKLVTPTEIINLVSSFYGVGIQQLKGERRTKQLAWARQVLMYFLTTEMRLPLVEVGRLLGGRDHTTILHGRDKVIAEISDGGRVAAEIEQLKRKLLI